MYISKQDIHSKNKYYGLMWAGARFVCLFVSGASNVPQSLQTEDLFPKTVSSVLPQYLNFSFSCYF